jgi:uroporphyrin-III C-methyltransferase / precorrin-2 dehydrogenase / sirohydrochlorin ferrochelatase
MSAVEDRHDPSPAHPPRMQALARLPIFLALAGKRALVAGNGAPVAWKAELLAAAGADVAVFAERPCEELRIIAARAPRAAIALQQRAWRIEDFAGAAVAVGGFEDAAEAERFSGAARAAGVPVNVIDRPAYCDFSFGAIVNRSPLVIGISTDGAAPVFAQAIRAKLETMIPRGFARWADAARRWRQAVQSSGLSPSGRRRFWRAFAAFAVSNPQREPAPSDFDALLRRTEDQATVAEAGSITLAGAGPGDAELLTMRAVRALQSADIILIDDLLALDILDFARREAKMALVGKTGRSRQDEVTLMIALAKAGRRVVRLKGGGSPTSGREEIAACRRVGIAVEVVPGVTVGGARGETQRNKAKRLSDRAKNAGRLAPIPEMPLRACCGWPAVRPARRARALRSTSRG